MPIKYIFFTLALLMWKIFRMNGRRKMQIWRKFHNSPPTYAARPIVMNILVLGFSYIFSFSFYNQIFWNDMLKVRGQSNVLHRIEHIIYYMYILHKYEIKYNENDFWCIQRIKKICVFSGIRDRGVGRWYGRCCIARTGANDEQISFCEISTQLYKFSILVQRSEAVARAQPPHLLIIVADATKFTKNSVCQSPYSDGRRDGPTRGGGDMGWMDE